MLGVKISNFIELDKYRKMFSVLEVEPECSTDNPLVNPQDPHGAPKIPIVFCVDQTPTVAENILYSIQSQHRVNKALRRITDLP